MTRRYDDLVDVRRRDDVPAEFLWRGRLYVVRDVLAHWIEAGAWWRAPAARPVYGIDPVDLSGAVPHPPGAVPDATSGAVPDATLDTEREIWRVEASGGRAHGSGVYDLCFDWTAGAWTLSRALD